MSANDKQVGGNHYSKEGEQHWDRIYRLHGRGYFVGCATKYIERYHLKNGKQDLEKAIHFIEKLIELEYPNENEGFESKKYPDDYQEQLSLKMEKMREDAMTGIPDHMRDVVKEESALSPKDTKYAIYYKEDSCAYRKPEWFGSYKEGLDPQESAISPMLRKFWGGEEPMPHGYVNQDGPDHV